MVPPDASRTPRAPVTRARMVLYVIAAAVTVLLVVSVLGSSPAVCGACHRPYADSLTRTAHKNVSCYGCHLDAGWASWPSFKATELTSMYPRMLLGGRVSGPGVRVARDRCASCHAGVLAKTILAKGTRIDHAACAKGASCDTCHGAVAHGTTTRYVRQPVMDDCVRCHLARKATVNCDSCHVEKSTRERLAAGPWQVTHGANWRKTHGMGDITVCSVCHPQTKCVTCHATPLPHGVDFGRTHGASAKSPDQKCAGCHDRKAFCTGCHGIDMPHGPTFLKDHAKIAKGRTDPVCVKCHYQDDCDTCHAKHTHPGTTKGTLKGALPKTGGSK